MDSTGGAGDVMIPHVAALSLVGCFSLIYNCTLSVGYVSAICILVYRLPERRWERDWYQLAILNPL